MKDSAFQFTNPILKKITFSINDEYDAKEHKSIGVNNHFKVEINKSFKENTALVELTAMINLDDAKSPFQIDAVMVAGFKWDSELESDTVDCMLKQNAPALLLSYLRPIISNVMNASPFPPYNIPFMNFATQEDDIITIKSE